jgi:hypothetical protein
MMSKINRAGWHSDRKLTLYLLDTGVMEYLRFRNADCGFRIWNVRFIGSFNPQSKIRN